MGKKLSELVEATVFSITDIFHLRTSGGIDKKITGLNLSNSLFIPGGFKGLLSVQLTNYIGAGLPAIVANSWVEINGAIYTNPGEVAITGVTANTTWYDILLTPSGSSFTASFVARGTGIWSDSKQGLYSGNNRVVACVYRIAVDNWINKNILEIKNRTILIEVETGDWDMDFTAGLVVDVGISKTKMRSIIVIIRNDDDDRYYPLDHFNFNDGLAQGGYAMLSVVATDVNVYRLSGGIFDTVDYDTIPYNRGWVTIGYEA